MVTFAEVLLSPSATPPAPGTVLSVPTATPYSPPTEVDAPMATALAPLAVVRLPRAMAFTALATAAVPAYALFWAPIAMLPAAVPVPPPVEYCAWLIAGANMRAPTPMEARSAATPPPPRQPTPRFLRFRPSVR